VSTLPPRLFLSTGYRPLGSCSRAAGWSAATLCHGPEADLARRLIAVCFRRLY
jgi:hypothetical protein